MSSSVVGTTATDDSALEEAVAAPYSLDFAAKKRAKQQIADLPRKLESSIAL
jgi:hypothetical protein